MQTALAKAQAGTEQAEQQTEGSEKVVAQLDAFVIVVLRSRSHTGQLNKEAEVELLDYYGCCASCG